MNWAKAAQGSALHFSKTAIILRCVSSKGQTVDQILHTQAIIPDIMGLTSQKKEKKNLQTGADHIIGEYGEQKHAPW